MIPFQGLIANIIAVIALVVLWQRPIPVVWWVILGLLIADVIFTRTLKESIRMYGMKDKASFSWGIVCTIVQLSLIGLSIYVFVS